MKVDRLVIAPHGDDEAAWRPVVGYEGLYEVSSGGQVRSLPRRGVRRNRLYGGKMLTGVTDSSGHVSVMLCRPDLQRHFLVHRLVLEAFVGPCPAGQESRHLNDVPDDNQLANLAWGTREENMADRAVNGGHYNARKTHCPAGHDYTPENTRLEGPDGRYRRCLACQRERDAERRSA